MSNEILYNSQVISFLEELWGDGFLSPGGSDEVKKVIEGIQIKDKRVLDIGSGSGAPDPEPISRTRLSLIWIPSITFLTSSEPPGDKKPSPHNSSKNEITWELYNISLDIFCNPLKH